MTDGVTSACVGNLERRVRCLRALGCPYPQPFRLPCMAEADLYCGRGPLGRRLALRHRRSLSSSNRSAHRRQGSIRFIMQVARHVANGRDDPQPGEESSMVRRRGASARASSDRPAGTLATCRVTTSRASHSRRMPRGHDSAYRSLGGEHWPFEGALP